jgi:hypothetical protein
MIEKYGAIRSRKYLDWVKTLDCCMCRAPDYSDPHHITGKGQGGMGTKADDLYTMPLCRHCHDEMHKDPGLWADQWAYVAQTLREAVKQGVLKL